MKLLEQNDYTQLFFRAIQYDTKEKITAYFKGKYNEEKECNPLELFIDGMNKAYDYFSGQFKQIYHDEMKNYYLLCSQFPEEGEYEKPDINNHSLPRRNIDRVSTDHYSNMDIERIKQGFDEFVKQEKSKDICKIRELDIDSLELSPDVFKYYKEHWFFTNLIYNQETVYPILANVSTFISDNQPMQYPWKAYVKGFVEEYKKPLNDYVSTSEGKSWLMRHIKPNPSLPTISYKYTPDQVAYFSEEEAVKYGEYMAKAFKTWEVIIEELPAFEAIFKGEKESKEEQSTTVKPKLTTYLWQNNPDEELPELYNLMQNKHKLILSNTTLDDFKAIFTGQPIETITPIRWAEDNASELLYFITQLEQTDQIKHTNRGDYEKMKGCFVKPDGCNFEASFKNLKTNLDTTLAKDKQEIINEIVSNF